MPHDGAAAVLQSPALAKTGSSKPLSSRSFFERFELA